MATSLPRALARGWPSLAAGITALALLAKLAWSGGGYFAADHLWAGWIALAVLGVLLLVAAPHWALTTPALVALGALAGYALWTGLATRWSPSPDSGLEEFQRSLSYVGLFGLGLLAAGSGRFARHLVWAVLGLIVTVSLAALVARLDGHEVVRAAGPAGYRLSGPLGYWNGLGALAAAGAVLAVGLASDLASRVALRGVAATAGVVLAVVLYLTLSRGAWAALVAGLVVLVVLGARRASVLASLALVGGAAALAVARLRGLPALTDDPAAGAGQVAAGRAFAPLLVVLALGAGLVQAAIAAGQLSPLLRPAVRSVLKPVLAVAVAVAALLAAGAYAVASDRADGWTAARATAASRFADRQWREFMTPATFSEGGTARLASARGTRSDLYRVALDGWRAHPVAGEGAGSYEQRFARERRVDEKVRNAHSLYLETLSELGLAGLALLLVFAGSLFAAGVRSRRRTGALGRGQAGAVLAACTVWVVHAGLDWDWQVPAVTGTVLLLAAALCPRGLGRRRAG